ncbi:hypothetical protein NXX61_26530 [Bacteroides ovatus]|nr:hypothetical protein [Bacteroides ovatus]
MVLTIFIGIIKASELDGNGPYYGADIQAKVANNYDPEGKYGNTNWTKEVLRIMASHINIFQLPVVTRISVSSPV